MTSRARIAAYGSAGGLVAVGIICEATISSNFGQILGFALIGLGLVTVISLVFFEIGLSEDRERAAEQHTEESKPTPRPRPRQHRPLDRSRGQRRHLS
jgi:hypothetical protein